MHSRLSKLLMHRKGFFMSLYLEELSWQKFDKEAGRNSQFALLVRAGRGHTAQSSMIGQLHVNLDVPIYTHLCI